MNGIKETTKIIPSNQYNLWCPFCDEWKYKDSMIARKRLGLHLVNEHSAEVRFGKNDIPPELRDID